MSRRRHSAGRGRTAPKRSSPSHFPLGHPHRFSSRAARHHYLLRTPHHCIAGTLSQFHCEAIGSPSDASCTAFPTPPLSSSAPLKPMASPLNPKSSQHPWLHGKHASTRKRTLCFHYLLLLRFLPLQSILLRLKKNKQQFTGGTALAFSSMSICVLRIQSQHYNQLYNQITKIPRRNQREALSFCQLLFAPWTRSSRDCISSRSCSVRTFRTMMWTPSTYASSFFLTRSERQP